MMEKEENILSVLSEQNIENLLTPSDVVTIQTKLWDILRGRADSYSKGGSSSVRVETAQELLKSAGFVLRHGMAPSAEPEKVKAILLSGDYDALFRAGLEAIRLRVEEGQTLLDRALQTASEIDNSAYRDTLRELGVFFKRYHYHHFAHEIPCVLDYPLAQSVDEALLGIDYINEYLRRLIMENEFCARFETAAVTALLRSISPDYKDSLLNIYEAVLTNALALTLLKSDAHLLDITDRDREKLYGILRPWMDGGAPAEVRKAASALCAALDITDPASVGYLIMTAEELFRGLKPIIAANRLDRAFPPLFRQPENKVHAPVYQDNAPMDDEELRVLIAEIAACRYVSDKIELVKQNVHSLRDYFEILNICFWDEECIVLFDSLTHEELKHLRLALKQKQSKSPEWTSETGWENYLADYAKGK